MSAPTPESLAMDCGLKCDMCKEEVNYGDDYIAHLQVAHSVTQNIPFFMNKALAKIKGEKKKIADVVTLEEESTEMTEEPKRSEDSLSDTFVLDASTKENIEKTVEKTMDDLFKGIRSLLEGKVPLEEVDEESSNVTDEDPFAADEKIWQSFENLKEVVNNIEFPVELLQQLVAPKTSDKEEIDQSEDTLEELVASSVADQETTQFRRPSSKKKSREVPSQVPIHTPATIVQSKQNPSPKPTPTQLVSQPKAPINSNQSQTPTFSTKLAPVKSDQSDKSTACNSGTFFLCPVENCRFFTTKQGMLDGAAANHLNKTHKITGPDMKAAAPGTYKFNKVKGEPRA